MAAAFVQSATGTGAASNPPFVIMDVAPTSGNLLVAAVPLAAARTFTPTSGWTAGPTGSQFGSFYKIAGASESTTQAPCTLSSNTDWACAIDEYSPGAATVTLDVSGATDDATSPQDQAALNPTDNIDTILWAAASNEAARTYSGQTIGGAAATERSDFQQAQSVSVSTFDRLNVNTSTSTFAAQATASGVPNNGAIALLIFKLPTARTVAGSQPTATGVLSRIFKAMRALAGLQPSATGILGRQLAALRTLAGAQEAATGTLVALFSALQRSMAGAQEAATGTLVAVLTQVRVLAGSQGEPNGVLSKFYAGGRVLEGIQAAAAGALGVLAPTPNVGGTATLTETLQDTVTLSEALRDTATLTVVPLGG